jgi:regulator of microtubule dynamics protein 3
LAPDDPTILHFLGRFTFAIAGISWMERKLASSLFSTPPDATYSDSLGYFMLADEKSHSPFIKNSLWIGHVHLKLGNKKLAKEWYTKVVQAVPECEADKMEIAEATTALKKL